MDPNREQRGIIAASKSARRVKAVALAGTGKTSTMVLLGEASPYRQFLYVAFNKAAQLDAQARFPRNVKCMTSHGMVFGAYGKRYSNRLNAPRVPASRAASILGLREERIEYCVSCSSTTEGGTHHGHAVLAETITRNALASLVTRGVDRYCHSADLEPQWWHVPAMKGADDRLQMPIRQMAASHVRDAWEDLKSPGGQLKFTHDCYLKLAQLGQWRPSQMAIILDEAQDTNPVVADMLLGESAKRLVVVGDPNQAIYEWRGAQDAIDGFGADVTCGLTGSYRFGPEIAENANVWLRMLGSEFELKGWKKKESHVVERLPEGAVPNAVLTRSNGGAIVAAMHWLEAGKRVAIVGGGQEIERLARGAMDLQAGRRSEHPDLVAFESWGAVQAYCKEEAEEAGTLVPLVRAIDAHGPAVIMGMTRSLVAEDVADVTVSTAHKAKGRQWPVVQIGMDFPQPKEGSEGLQKEELRLAYVAVTRAEDTLVEGSLDWARKA